MRLCLGFGTGPVIGATDSRRLMRWKNTDEADLMLARKPMSSVHRALHPSMKKGSSGTPNPPG